MKKLIGLFVFLYCSIGSSQDFRLNISNSKMVDSGTQGIIDLGTFNPFNLTPTCSTYIAPNACYMINTNTLRLTLGFNYVVQIFNGSTVDLDFSFDNGNGGMDNPFANVVTPGTIFGVTHNSSGVTNLVLDMDLRGPNAKPSYSGTFLIDVTHNF